MSNRLYHQYSVLIARFSAFVGLASMVLLFPLPGYVASRLQGVQQQHMKSTDARVQNVTEGGISPILLLYASEASFSVECHSDDQAPRLGAQDERSN